MVKKRVLQQQILALRHEIMALRLQLNNFGERHTLKFNALDETNVDYHDRMVSLYKETQSIRKAMAVVQSGLEMKIIQQMAKKKARV